MATTSYQPIGSLPDGGGSSSLSKKIHDSKAQPMSGPII
jgi:hypothetical protein